MSKSRQTRYLHIKRINDLTPNMRRITLTGDDLISVPSQMAGGYVKLVFGSPDDSIVRTYTIAGQRIDENEVDIDFMLHGDHGVASSWAGKAKLSDAITMMGNGPRKKWIIQQTGSL